MPNPIHKGGRPTPTEHPCWYVVVGYLSEVSTISLVPPFLDAHKAEAEVLERNAKFVDWPTVKVWGIKTLRKVGP